MLNQLTSSNNHNKKSTKNSLKSQQITIFKFSATTVIEIKIIIKINHNKIQATLNIYFISLFNPFYQEFSFNKIIIKFFNPNRFS